MWCSNISQCQACQCLSQPHSLPLMTGVKTAMPAKFGLVTVLSRIKPPTLQGHMGVSHTQITAQFAITPNDIVQQGNRWWSAVKCDLLTGNSNLGVLGFVGEKFRLGWGYFTWWSGLLMALPADGHGDDDWLPTRVEQFSGGRDRPGYQHPQGAHSHKGRTHQWVGIVVVFCVGGRTQRLRMLLTIGHCGLSRCLVFVY